MNLAEALSQALADFRTAFAAAISAGSDDEAATARLGGAVDELLEAAAFVLDSGRRILISLEAGTQETLSVDVEIAESI